MKDMRDFRHSKLSAKAVARASHLSLYGCPACPFTQLNSTSCVDTKSYSLCQRSGFFSSSRPRRQPCALQPSTQPKRKASTRYFESEYNLTEHGSLRASRPAIAASSSIRLFVVIGSPPDISFSYLPYTSIAPLPPRPGLPRQAPSVYK